MIRLYLAQQDLLDLPTKNCCFQSALHMYEQKTYCLCPSLRRVCC